MKKRSFHLSPGAPSLVLIVVVLSMSIMGMLMFIRTQNDKKLSQRSIQVAIADAALFEQAEKTYAALDALVAESKAQAANDEVFLEWHEWLAGIVREYFPNTPLHAKTMKTISLTNPYGSLCDPKPEVFDSFSDWTGTDCVSYFKETDGSHSDYSDDGFLLKMLWYDFLFSTTGKPVYNSEDHIVQDQHDTFDEKYAIHSRADLWQGMMHHNKMSTVWVWHRTYNADSEQYNSVLHSPDF